MNKKENNSIHEIAIQLVDQKQSPVRGVEIIRANTTYSDVVERLINQELFRQFLIKNGVARDVVLSRSSYSDTSDIVGCFLRDSRYHVYNTDERYKVYGEKCFDTAIEAYQEIARRLGLSYSVSDRESLFGSGSSKYKKTALEYWSCMSRRYGDTADGDIARKNKMLLEKVIKNDQVFKFIAKHQTGKSMRIGTKQPAKTGGSSQTAVRLVLGDLTAKTSNGADAHAMRCRHTVKPSAQQGAMVAKRFTPVAPKRQRKNEIDT